MENILKYNYILNKTNITFFEILERRDQLTSEDPFVNVGCKKLCEEIIGLNLNLNFELNKDDLETIKFIVIDDLNFDGKIDFLKELINVEYVYINGNNGIGKIIDLSAIQYLKKIKYLNIHNCLIQDLLPISNLIEIEYLLLRNNPLKTIKPVCHFKKIKKLEISYQPDCRKEEYFTYDETEFEELKINSVNCEIKFVSFDALTNEYFTKTL
ncbi:hypothetical protein [Flavobacterium sp.]|uniref:hypothetical protein n=1 Tax=Flavobacterium sp. TaxID=239 RepID=UPI0037527DD1